MKSPSDGRLRLAGVGYLNARPLYEGLNREPVSSRVCLELASPREVARLVAEDEADLGQVPVAALASLGDARVVRGVAIGARGNVRSVALLSSCPIDEVTDLLIDASSRTSVVLARLILRARRQGKEPRLHACPPAEAIARSRSPLSSVSAHARSGSLPHVIPAPVPKRS